MWSTLLMVAIGGACGALLRFGVSHVSKQVVDDALPAATLAVNLIGCFAAGFLVRAMGGPWQVPEHLRAGLIVGVLGGLTTFSAFGIETVRMLESGRWVAVTLFLVANVAGGVACVAFGQAVARVWLAVEPVAGASR